jgi:hypothetical protein
VILVGLKGSFVDDTLCFAFGDGQRTGRKEVHFGPHPNFGAQFFRD